MAIYTKGGDKGETGLFSPAAEKIRVSKNSLRIHAVGSVDELNSYLGVVISHSESQKLREILLGIQRDLLTIGSIIGGSKMRFSGVATKKFEKIIDTFDEKLPPLKNFILPGGGKVSSHLHFARSLARRMERSLVALNEAEKINPKILIYINRLSDFLFMLARNENFQGFVEENIWIGKKN